MSKYLEKVCYFIENYYYGLFPSIIAVVIASLGVKLGNKQISSQVEGI